MSDDIMNSLIEQRKKREANASNLSLSEFSDLDILNSKSSLKDNSLSSEPQIRRVAPVLDLDLNKGIQAKTPSTLGTAQQESQLNIESANQQRPLQQTPVPQAPPTRIISTQAQDRQRMLQQMQAQQGQISPAQQRARVATNMPPNVSSQQIQDRQRMLQQMQAQQGQITPAQQRARTMGVPSQQQIQDRQRMLQQMQAQQGQISPAQQRARTMSTTGSPAQTLSSAPMAPQQSIQPAINLGAVEKPKDISQIMAQEIKQSAENTMKAEVPKTPAQPATTFGASQDSLKLFDSAPSANPNAGNSRNIIESARRAAMQKKAAEQQQMSRQRMSPASAGLLAEMRGQTQKPAPATAPALQNIKVEDPSISDEVDRLLKQIGEFHEISDKLNEEIDKLKTQQTRFTQFITVFFNQDTVENALDTIFSSIKNFMKCDALEFMYLDEPQGLIFLYSLTNDGIFQWEEYISYKGTAFEPVISAQQPDIVNDLSLKDDYPVSDIAKSFGLKSLLRMPCASAESFVGYLDIFAKDSSAYTEEERQKASTYAIAAAFFFENMFLKEKLSYIRKSSRPKPDRDYLNMTEYLKQQFDKPFKEMTENADNALNKKYGKLMPKQSEFINNIKEELTFVGKCSFYLKEYLEFTADQKQPRISRIDIKKVVDEVNKRIKDRMEAKTVRMMIEIEKKPPQILADYSWMTRILYALVENALEATEIGRAFRLSVDTTSDPEYAEFCVYDNGKDQIMSGDYSNIFTPFGTLSTKANKKRTRLFLNLPIVKMYVERMNGMITVDSQKEDTMFSVKIPIAKRR